MQRENMNRFLTPLITLFVSAIFTTQASAVAIDLGDASQYSVFTKNDFKVTSSDTEARIAVGGDFIVAGQYDVGAEMNYMGLGGGPRLVVGGNIVKTTSASFNVHGDGLTPAGTYSGEIVYAGKVLNNGIEITSAVSGNVEGTLTKVSKANLPVDFDNAFAHLNKLSTDLMAATVHGETVKKDWPLVFKPTTTPSDNVYVFNVTQEQINSTTGWSVEGVSDDATIVFNISNENNIAGKNNNSGGECVDGQVGCIQLSGVQLSINGVAASSNFLGKGHGPGNSKGAWLNNTMTNNVLFNFGDATQVNLATDMYGSVLAPNADIKANPSVIWGQVIGKSWEGNMQVNYNPFTSVGVNPTDPTPVPTPATIWLFVLAFALLYVNRKPFIRVKRKSEADTASKALTHNSVTV